MRGSLDVRAAVWLHALCTGSATRCSRRLGEPAGCPGRLRATEPRTHAHQCHGSRPSNLGAQTPSSHHLAEESFLINSANFCAWHKMEALADELAFDAPPPPPLETRPVRFGAWVRPAGLPVFLALTARPRAGSP